ncbi:ABC transporter permease [Spiroplasma endosymbiont of Virgichneumon dumeticola]|uniref:ABC transporter permease n=1 Tax=Spiroplasma endosymbiont of Virgichneumon dumeticola TaxID=3139323 RepID=UPI0035C8B918
MKNLFVNVFRGIKKRLIQYVGILLLLVIVVSSLSALYSNSERIESGFYTVLNNSGKYDYSINLKSLNSYKDIDASTLKIKGIIKEQFEGDPEKPTIDEQINKIEATNIRNNTFPAFDLASLNPKLETYLLNWGLNYQGILLNNILETDLKNYLIDKSFFKSFDYKNAATVKSLYFSFEDAFYRESDNFDFSPTRNDFNKVYISQGLAPTSANEVVINSDFAKKNNINLNDTFEFIQGDNPLKVVGFGYAYWGITGSRSATKPNPTPDNATPVYTSREWFNSSIKNSSYRTNLESNLLLKVKNNNNYFIEALQNLLIKTFSFSFGTIITTDTEDVRSGQILETFQMQKIVFSAITIVVLLVIIFIIMSYVRKEIDLQKPQVGLLKALGYNNFQIAIAFVSLILFITLASNIVGLVLGLPLQILFNSLNNIGFYMPLPNLFFSLVTLFTGLVIIPIIFVFVSYLQSELKLCANPLLLIYDRRSNTSSRIITTLKYPFRYWPFKQRLAIAFTLKSVGKLFLVFFTFVFVSFLLLFQTTATDLFDNKVNNLYGYYNKDVEWNTKTTSMYTYNNSSDFKIKDDVFYWASQKDIIADQTKLIGATKYFEWKADDFHIDSTNKYNKIFNALLRNDFKNNFISSEEINILYHATKDNTKCKNFINPSGLLTPDQTDKICVGIHKLFSYLSDNTGINPELASLPGISIGLNIYNTNYYPDIETSIVSPTAWDGHSQSNMQARRIKVTGVYNNPDQNLAWKNWFNFKEEKQRDIDPVFNNSHILKKENISYTNNQGQKVVGDAFTVPATISKSLAILNGYKIDSQFLMLANWYNYTMPIIFEVKGIISNNLDTSNVYTNLDDLRTAIGLVDIANNPIPDAFNFWISKDANIFPLNYINVAQSEGKYDMSEIQKQNLIPINKLPFVNSLVKKLLVQIFDGIITIISITKFLTLFAVAFVLIIIINMILDNNLLIIAMMKSLGYRVNEINRLIIGSYVIALVVAFVIGTIFSYVIWHFITLIIASRAGTVFNVPISPFTILTSFGLVFLIMVIGYAVGLYLIKYKSVTVLLQGS